MIRRDAYGDFLKNYNISEDNFLQYGATQIIMASKDECKKAWDVLKNSINSNECIPIRGFGRDAQRTVLYLDMYKDCLGLTNVYKDPTNNYNPKKIIQRLTGLRRGKDIINYQVSHVFGKTKNVWAFNAPFNIVYMPKIYDPYTGHESSQDWAKKFQSIFHQKIFDQFGEFIDEFNEIVIQKYPEIDEYILQLMNNVDSDKELSDLKGFRESVKNEFHPITKN